MALVKRVISELGAWVGNTSLGLSEARDVAVFIVRSGRWLRRVAAVDAHSMSQMRSTDNRPCGSAAGHEAGQSGDADVAVEFA